jgi:hypothetical protein
MACKNTKILNSFAQTTSYSTYEIPERYRNSFCVANAALFDQANWFLHRAYEICFPRLVSRLKERQKMLTDSEANKKLMTAVFENHTKNVWVLFKKPKLVAIAAKQKKIGTN